MSKGVVEVNCKKDPAECEAYLQNGYIKLSEFKLIEQTAFVDRFTNEKCVKAFDHVGIIREVALYAVDLPSSERKDPLRHNSDSYEDSNFLIRNQYIILIIIGIIATITNFHLLVKAVKNVRKGRYSHIVHATLFATMFLFCGLEMSITTFIFEVLDVYVDKKETPKLHQTLLTVTETRRRVVGAVTSLSAIFTAIDRLIHFNNHLNIQKRKKLVKRNAKFFVCTVILAILDCIIMSFLESHWRANKRYVTEPNDEDVIYYSSYKIFDDGKHEFNIYRILDVFDAMLPVTFIFTTIICLSIYSVTFWKILRKFNTLRNTATECQSHMKIILRKSLHTVSVNLGSVLCYVICWFPYAILSRLSEMNTNCARTYYTTILLRFEPGSFGWESTTFLYSISGVLFYLFAVMHSLNFMFGHRQYSVKLSSCRRDNGDVVGTNTNVETYVPVAMLALNRRNDDNHVLLEDTLKEYDFMG